MAKVGFVGLGTAVSNEFLTAARAMGLEKKDLACVFEVLAAWQLAYSFQTTVQQPQ